MSSPLYDSVIIGGGTSGLTVADCFTENPGLQMLGVEAGDCHLADPRVSIPALTLSLQETKADWKYGIVAQVIRKCYPEAHIPTLPTHLSGQPKRSKSKPDTRPTTGRLKCHQPPSSDSPFKY